MMTKWQMVDIIGCVTYPGMEFNVCEPESGPLYLQLEFTEKCSQTGGFQKWKSRKWQLSCHMTRSELVQTAMKAVLTALEHEARENFKYRGRSIFDPHYDVDQLWGLRGQDNALETRE